MKQTLKTAQNKYLVLVNGVPLLLMLQSGAELGLALKHAGHQVMTAHNQKRIINKSTPRKKPHKNMVRDSHLIPYIFLTPSFFSSS